MHHMPPYWHQREENLNVAEHFFRESLRIRERELPAVNQDLCTTLYHLGVCLGVRGAYVESVDLLRRACSFIESYPLANHETKLRARLTLVTSLTYAGLFSDADTELSSIQSVINDYACTRNEAHPLADDFEEAKQFVEEERRGCCE
jgi:hypothetical protein